MRGAPEPLLQAVSCLFGSHLQDQPQLLFELIALVELGLALCDELEPLGLRVSQMLGRLAERVSGAFDAFGQRLLFLVLLFQLTEAGLVGGPLNLLAEIAVIRTHGLPDLRAKLVNRLARPLHDEEGINAACGLRGVLLDALVDPARAVTGDVADRGTLLRAERFEELLEHALAVFLADPHDFARIVIDDDSHVLVALATGGLVNADIHQPVEPAFVGVWIQMLLRTSHTAYDGPPVDAHVLMNGRPRHVLGLPRDGEIELLGEPRAGEGPGNRLGDHAVIRAIDAGGSVAEIDQHAAEIQSTPAARPVAARVVAGAKLAAMRASVLQTLVGADVNCYPLDAPDSLTIARFNNNSPFDIKEVCQ